MAFLLFDYFMLKQSPVEDLITLAVIEVFIVVLTAFSMLKRPQIIYMAFFLTILHKYIELYQRNNIVESENPYMECWRLFHLLIVITYNSIYINTLIQIQRQRIAFNILNTTILCIGLCHRLFGLQNTGQNIDRIAQNIFWVLI